MGCHYFSYNRDISRRCTSNPVHLVMEKIDSVAAIRGMLTGPSTLFLKRCNQSHFFLLKVPHPDRLNTLLRCLTWLIYKTLFSIPTNKKEN
jgi:hypothetical protein